MSIRRQYHHHQHHHDDDGEDDDGDDDVDGDNDNGDDIEDVLPSPKTFHMQSKTMFCGAHRLQRCVGIGA